MPDQRAGQAPPDEAEYREQVLERFTARARTLNNQLALLMVFAFGFLVFIILPLAALNFDAAHVDAQQEEIERLAARSQDVAAKREEQQQEADILRGNITSLTFVLEQKRQEAETRAGNRARLQADLAANSAQRQERLDQAKSLEGAVKNMEKTLARFDADQRVGDLRNWFFETAFGSDRDPECEDNDRRVYFRCLVRKKLEDDWTRDFSLIRQEVVQPLGEIAPDTAGAIEGELSDARQTFQDRLEANQDFWQSIDGKADFMARLSEDFSLAFGKIRSVVQQRLDKIARQAADLETEIATLTQAGQELETEITALDREAREIEAETEAKLQELGGKEAAIETIEGEHAALTAEIEGLRQKLADLPKLSEIETQRAEIETRLAGFASPFGSIPIGLKEAVLAYPLILAAGFLVCALLLSRLLALRRAFRSSLAMEKSLSDADVDRRVATLTSLWFDPGRQLWANPALLLALIIPFAFFVATGWLILNDWLLQLGDTASAVNLRAFYAGLYALGLAVFAAGLARVWIAWRQD